MAGVTQATRGRARLQPGTQGSARWAQRSGFPAGPWMILPCPHPAPSPHTSSPFWEDLGFCPSSPATHLPLTYFTALAQKPFRALADKIGEIESLPTHPAVEAPRLAATCQGQTRKPDHSRSSSKDNRSYNSTSERHMPGTVLRGLQEERIPSQQPPKAVRPFSPRDRRGS